MVDQFKQWWKDQSTITTVIITMLTFIVGILMTGFWMNITTTKDEVIKLRTDVSGLRETLPANYVGLVEYLKKEAVIRVHDETNQSILSGMQTQMALTNERLVALIESMKSYRQEYREDNPYVNERGPAYNNKKAGIEHRRGEEKGSNK